MARLRFTKVLLSATAVAAVWWLSSSCVVSNEDKGSATVMFTWSNAEFDYIQSIAASYEDVRYWRENVYDRQNYINDNITAYPNWEGSSDIRDKIYSKDRPQDATRYKGVCLPISKGSYTAICAVNDNPFMANDNTYYIVANYKIDVGAPGTKRYYEVAFDVRSVLDGIDGRGDTAWVFKEHTNNPCQK